MITFLQENLATILIALGILLVVIWVVHFLINNRKKGKTNSCGSGCDHCSSSHYCHKL